MMRAFSETSYVICTTPRSGSTMLCGLLRSTGVAGWPESHFHRPALGSWLADHGLAQEDYASDAAACEAVFAAAIERGKAGGDVFALRLQRDSFPFFFETLARLVPDRAGDAARFEQLFGQTRFIHLFRGDPVDQAISRLRAEQTGLWHRRADGSVLEQEAPTLPPGYDRAEIEAHVTAITAQNDAWMRWFAREGIMPIQVRYEDLAAAPKKTLHDLLAALGLDAGRAEAAQVQTARLADVTNRAWRQRFDAGR
ncbi:MAG: Stf0 family sulfotransferase [Pseudomonadota bacterium]